MLFGERESSLFFSEVEDLGIAKPYKQDSGNSKNDNENHARKCRGNVGIKEILDSPLKIIPIIKCTVLANIK